jgi:hypothetical protein
MGWDKSFAGYRRRLDCFEYRAKRRDVPRDIDQLLALTAELEALDERIVDSEHSTR